ncbi:MAG: thymidine phosphorylase [Gemmatimonadota bacterium]
MLSVPRLIERKRDGQSLTGDEWRWLMTGYVAGAVPDYQMAALAMAVLFRGLEDPELVALTEAMRTSGDQLSLGHLPIPRVDKHSTGGVGDKTSLLLAPMLACLGVAVPMISGRGLGHTGGTLDKLEAIPGFRTGLGLTEAVRQLERIGVVMLGQTPELVPADRKLYALRDVTGTVSSIPLIAASIMAKKLSEDLNGLVLDVKTGSGAFIQDPAQSLVLAETMIRLGEASGCRTVALITAMDRPLGVACGNALEVAESIEGLSGGGPADLMEVTYGLGVEMLLVSGLVTDRRDAARRLESVITSGAALAKLEQLIAAQGGDPAVVRDPARLPRAPVVEMHRVKHGGTVLRVEPRRIGEAIIALGGGRQKTDDRIDPAVGFRVLVKPGQSVRAGADLVEIHARSIGQVAEARVALEEAIEVGEGLASFRPLISDRVTWQGIETW